MKEHVQTPQRGPPEDSGLVERREKTDLHSTSHSTALQMLTVTSDHTLNWLIILWWLQKVSKSLQVTEKC